MQLFNSGKFRPFDWGKSRNLQAYGNSDPPDYSFGNITIPIAVFYSNGDALLSNLDVEVLLKKLQNVIFTKFFDDNQWNHFDYLLARSVQENVNNVIIDSLKGF